MKNICFLLFKLSVGIDLMIERMSNMKKNRLLFLAFISSALVIFMEFTQWKIIDIVTEFLMVPIWIFVFVLFAIITVRAIIHLVKNRDWKPFAIQFMTLLLWIFFPFTQVVLDVDFKVNKAEREEVVRMVENGELKPNLLNDQSFIRLPKKISTSLKEERL